MTESGVQGVTQLFLVLLALGLAIRLWLAQRHVRHVQSHRARVPAAFRGRITAAAHRKAADYTVAKTRFGIVTGVIDVVLLLAWTLGGGLELLDQAWRAAGFGELLTGTGFLVSVFLILGLLELPASLYQTFVLEARFGFNRTTPAVFVADLLKQALLLAVIGVPLAVAALWLMRAAGERWWLYLWLLWSGFTLFMIWAYPTVIAPLFNKFAPLRNRLLLKRIQRLLRRTGFESRGVFVMDGSRRSAHGNAYFTGFGRHKRIVFFDTLPAAARHGDRGGAGPRARPLPSPPYSQAHRAAVRAEPGRTGAARLAGRPGVVLHRVGDVDALEPRRADSVPDGGPGVQFLSAAAAGLGIAPPRIPGRCLRRPPGRYRRHDPRPGEAVSRKRQHPHARPPVLGVLRFPSAGRIAHRPSARTGLNHPRRPR
jgi:hypothetical protein